ncbi:hypothetical protein DYQ86_18780 [Acidobacteria bacterium AB60]|nr:hypothetical protein DYQ86_18780 [Acidobacteria bacterium AB60]
MKISVLQSLLLTSGAILFSTIAVAQQDPPQQSQASNLLAKAEPEQTQTFFLKNATWTNDLNEVTTDLRNVVSSARIYGVATQNAITVTAKPEDMRLLEKQITELDRPKKVYRVTFTIDESESGRKTGTQHYAVIVSGDNKSWIKQGNRVPIVTGSIPKESSGPITQIQYLDVGINIEVTINGVGLVAKVEQTSIADEKSNVGIQDPLVRQTTLQAMSTFVPGKPIAIGSIDIPGTARHQDIAAIVDPAQ